MKKEKITVSLGKTGIVADKNGFGALPIQRISEAESTKILRKAYANGVNFYDTARFYTDSEHKISAALGDVRDKIYIASKTMALTGEELRKDLATSLEQLETDYIDLYQFHNPPFCPKPDGEDGLYAAVMEAMQAGRIRHLGITNHRLSVAEEAIASGLYETLQFPLSYIATEKEERLVALCREAGMGFIAMKGLAGGLITDADAAWAYLNQFENVLPIWGIQKESELDAFLNAAKTQPTMDDAQVAEVIARDRAELQGDFCRGCGYCMPCPVEIEINTCARASVMMRRSPLGPWMTEDTQAKMAKIENCLHCGQCSARCPYGLDTPELLARNLEDYKQVLAEYKA